MHFLYKLFDLLRIYPWRNFGAMLCCTVLGFLIISLFNHRKSEKWLQKIKLSFSAGLSGILLAVSLVFIVFFSFFSYCWIKEVGRFDPLENYVINLTLLLSFSLLFGIIGFLIHLATAAAFKLDNINLADYYQSSQKNHLQATEKAQRKSSVWRLLSEAMEGDLSVRFLGYLDDGDPDSIRTRIDQRSFSQDKSAMEIYEIVGLPVYHVYSASISLPPHPTPPVNEFLAGGNLFLLQNRLLSTYPDLYFHFSRAVTNRLSDPKEYRKVKRIIQAEIDYIEQAVIPGTDEFYNGKHVKIKVFLYAYLIQALNFNQNYLVPLNNTAKCNHVLFALFRLLMQGTFLGLVIKNILKT
ncbi:hypothetical protein [Mucilaginibacter pedocola]|uniref:Uncharacterized protein n=1 Tax=Mucilaginibacter pedocola TaxID=1792845 RepID=A0A1S9PGY0_9SPHI|nr:hypothetical protein [Mucilaginibacter pedocola]OOQ59828.1 hypothetical protein BC343_06695 [Mucilaginibacter pedocola]